MSTINNTKELFCVGQDDLARLTVDQPLHHCSPQNLNYMAAYAVPVVNYLNERQPHVAIGCDRGGRLFSRAIYSMWYELMDGQPFPTLDHRIHFAYLSHKQAQKSESNKEKMRQRVYDIIDSSKVSGEKIGRILSPREKLRILFIDDFMNEGRIRALNDELLIGIDAVSDYAVMWRGKNESAAAEIYGTEGGPRTKMGRTGLDHPYEIGVDYEDIDEPVLITTDASVDNFRRLHSAVKRVAGIVKSEMS